MNILEAFSQANKGVDPKQIKKGDFAVQQQGSWPPAMDTSSSCSNQPPAVQPQHAVETTGDFDSSLSSIINQLKTLLNGYDLDEEDHEKLSSAIMKLDSLLPDGYVQVTSVSVQTTAPQQNIANQGMQAPCDTPNNTADYLSSMM